MKFTLPWLKNHLETNASLNEIANNLTEIGLEVENITDPTADLKDFTVAKIISVKKHPDADRLQLCEVDIGGEIKDVVCGATNARKNLSTIYAPIGSIIPKSNMEIKKVKIRGVESFGMLCSAEELNLGDDSEGIIEIDNDFEPGTKAISAFSSIEPVIEIAITPNRPDCLGVYGIARDLAAKGVGKLQEVKIKTIKETEKTIPVFIDSYGKTQFCNLFSGRLIEGITNNESPKWLKERLEKIGLRSINAIVDVTNYITYDYGRPLHAYNADKIKGRIGAKLSKKGDKIKTLDGKEYTLDDQTCIISDDEKILGIGGIIGGEEFGSELDTKNIFLESAYFDPVHIAENGRKLNINSDARYRFERGTDPEFVIDGLNLATQMIIEICGGKPGKLESIKKELPKVKKIKFNPKIIEKVSGISIKDKDIKKILESLGFEVSKSFEITIPSWRPDVSEQVDIVEEVIRIYGLNNIISSPLKNTKQPSKPILTDSQKNTNLARRILASRGLIENISYSFVSSKYTKLFSNNSNSLKLLNPISEELSDMRTTPLISLIDNFIGNKKRGFTDVGIFEIGPGFTGAKPGNQHLIASGLRTGMYKVSGVERHWQGNDMVDIFDVKSDILAYLDIVGIKQEILEYDVPGPKWFHPGRSANIISKKKNVLASFGEIHPKISKKLNLPLCVGFEIYLDDVLPIIENNNVLKEFNSYNLQSVKRDFSFDIPNNVSAETLIKAIRSCKEDLIKDIKLFDQFILDDEKKSLAVEITIQPKIDTLTDKEIDRISNKVINSVEKATKGNLRSQ